MRARGALYRCSVALLGVVLLGGLAVATDTNSASAASYCLNGSRQFVPCYELPAGSGTEQPAPVPEQTLHPRGEAAPEPGVGHSESKLHHTGTELAGGVVTVGLVLGVLSLAVGLRRRQKVPRWDDRGDYRAV